MKRRLLLIPLLIIVVLVAVAIQLAPETSQMELASCMQSETGDCLRFPTVSGDTLNGETVTLPAFFTGQYNLVILPFDREQQEGVIDWLPFVQDLQAEYDGLAYYSVGALPDVAAPVRLMISGGMRLAVEPAVRDVSVLLYLEDQLAFANALGVSSLEEAQLLILDRHGDVIWQASGAYSDTLANRIREQVAALSFEATPD